jgi:hypothetical protein
MQPEQKQGTKKFLRHLPTTFVPSLTLQSLISLCHATKHPDLEYGKCRENSSVGLSRLFG